MIWYCIGKAKPEDIVEALVTKFRARTGKEPTTVHIRGRNDKNHVEAEICGLRVEYNAHITPGHIGIS